MKKLLFLAITMMSLSVLAQPAGHFASQMSSHKTMPFHGAKNDYQWKMSSFCTDDYYQVCTFTYNADNRLLTMSDAIDGEYDVIDSMTYDAAGNLVRLSGWQLLNGVRQNVYYVDYTYNDAGLITSRSNYNNFDGVWELGGIYNYTYNSQNQLVLTTLNLGGMVYQKTEYQYDENNCVQELWYSYDFDSGTFIPSEKYVTSYVDGRKVLVQDSVSDDGFYWMYYGKSTFLYDNNGNCLEYHHYDEENNEVERSVYTYDNTMPLGNVLMPWNPEMNRPKTYDNVNACVREAWYSLDVDHVLQYVCDYIYDYEDVQTAVRNPMAGKVTLYPNPALGYVVLDGLSEKETEIQIFDISGRLLSTRNVTGSSSLMDVSDLASGCYVVRLLQGVSVQNVKLIVR